MKKIQGMSPFFVGLISILFFWKNTIFSFATRTHDWYDGSFMMWTLANNVRHFRTLDWRSLYETNAMYPFAQSLSFTDHLYFPSIFATLISFVTDNPVVWFNVLSVLNFVAVYISWYLLAGRFSRIGWVRLAVALYATFCPYVFTQFGHFQMLIVWPTVIALWLLLGERMTARTAFGAGILLGFQFLTGVYTGILGMSAVAFLFGARAVVTRRWLAELRQMLIVVSVCVAVASPSLWGYLQVNRQYRPVREQAEFVTYSAHASDYVFPVQSSVLYRLLPGWGDLNGHVRGERAAFIGLVPLGVLMWLLVAWRLRILAVFQNLLSRTKKNSYSGWTAVIMLWVILLVVVGFVFSVGPRANWNGTYLVFPLPYWAVMKVFTPIAIMRAVARWWFLVQLAVIIVFAIGLDRAVRIADKKIGSTAFVGVLAVVLVLFEFYPSPLAVSARNWQSPAYLFLKNQCNVQPGPILEFPFEYRKKAEDIGTYLSLKTNTLFSSTVHTCPTLSGFSSFEPPLFRKWQKSFDENGIGPEQMKILRDNEFRYVKVNRAALLPSEWQNLSLVIKTDELKTIYKDAESVVYKILSSSPAR